MKLNQTGLMWAILIFSFFAIENIGQAEAPAQQLSLENCVSMALQENLNVQMSQSDMDKSFALVKSAKGANGISVNVVNSDYWKRTTSSTQPDEASGDPFTLVTNQIAFTLPLYNGGKMEKTVDAAVIAYDTAKRNREISKAQIKYQTTVDYYKVLQYKNLLAADKRSIDDYTLHLQNLQNSYAAGLASRLQLLQTQVSLANAQDTFMKDKVSHENAVVALKNVIGMPRVSNIDVEEAGPYKVAASIEFDDCLKGALENRQEQIVAKNNVKVAEDNLGIAYSGKRPSLTLNGTDGLQGSKFSNDNKNYFSVYFTLSYNLFDSGVTSAQIEAAKADLNKAKKAAQQQEDTIYADVSQYYWGMKEAQKRIETSQVAVNQAEEVCKISTVSFAAGLETNQDVLDAEVALATAQNNYAQALYDYNMNKAGLQMAMGTSL
jgi:outer membrane protein